MKLETATREEMKQESIERLKMLKLHKNVIEDLENENTLNRSNGPLGLLFWLNEKEKQFVREFENKYNVFVYHVIKTNTIDFGFIYDLLYITDEKEYWQEERQRLKVGLALSYTKSQFSESGDIAIEKVNGGLVRLY